MILYCVLLRPSLYNNIYNIRDCGSTLYVGLAHAAPPTQYKVFTAFSTNWLSECSMTYTYIQGAADFKARITSQ